MRVTELHDEIWGGPYMSVIVCEKPEELRAIIVGLVLYSDLYAADPNDDSDTGHIASRLVGRIIDQADVDVSDIAPDEDYWTALRAGLTDSAGRAYRAAAGLPDPPGGRRGRRGDEMSEWTKDDEGGRLHPSCRVIDGNGLLVGTGILPEHADRIVLCCNAHDDLVAAIEQVLDDMGETGLSCCQSAKDMMIAALAKAGEK